MVRPAGMRGLLLAVLLVLPGSAAATSLTITDAVLTTAVGCTSTSCSSSSQTFELVGTPPVAVTGFVMLDSGLLTVGFDLSVGSATLVETVAGSEDNGVAEIQFAPISYFTTTPLSVSMVGSSYVLDAGQTVSVSGTQTQRNDVGGAVNGTPAGFLNEGVFVSGNCLPSGGTVTCGLTFGGMGFPLDVGDPDAGMSPMTRYFRHTINLVAIPEPGTGMLLAVGLAGLALARARRV